MATLQESTPPCGDGRPESAPFEHWIGPATLTVGSLLFCSGFSALVFQVAWLRELRLIFGTSTAASAAVLAIFMGGLGLGNALLGRRADRSARPLRLYAVLLLLIAASGAISPWLSDLARWTYISLGGQMRLGMAGATAVRLALSTVVLGLPTVLMGGTLPAAARAVTSVSDRHRRGLGLLYGMNELGAVLGVAASTFFLLEHLGTRATLWLACGIYLTTAVAAYWLGRRDVIVTTEEDRDSTLVEETKETTTMAGDAAVAPWLVYLSAGLVGFAFFVMELVWYRMLTPLLGGTTFTFGLILMAVLTGIGVGGAAYGWLFRRLRPTAGVLAMTCALEALCIAYPLAWGDGLAIQAALPRPEGILGFHSQTLGWALIAAVVVLPAAAVSGLQFPLLIALLGRGNRQIGRQVGLAFAWNTVGAIAGSLAGGFGLLPLLTAPGAWRAVVAVLCGLSVLLLLSSLRRATVWLALPAGVAAVALLMTRATGPTAVWRHSGIGAGRSDLARGDHNTIRDWTHEHRQQVVWEAEGVEASIAIRNAADGPSFFVNGKCDGDAIGDASMQLMAGLVEAALHPDPKTALVVGLGTGETAGWLAAVPSMRQVDIVEIEPAVTEMARRCAPLNHNVAKHPKVRLIYNDAREVLLTSTSRYDVIFSEPSNPYRAGIASLYTLEFYQSVRARLEPGGIFAQWLQAYDVDEQTVRTALATLRAVFAHVEVWQTNPSDLLLVCSTAPIRYDAAALRERISQEPFRTGLAVAWGAWDLEGFLARYVAGPKVVEEISREEANRLNTDDRNRIEYGFARFVGRPDAGFRLQELRDWAIDAQDHRPPLPQGSVSWERVEDHRQLLHLLHPSAGPNIPCPPDAGPHHKTRAAVLEHFINGEFEKVLSVWDADRYAPVSPVETAVFAMSLAAKGNDRAGPLIQQLRETLPTEAAAIEAILLWQQSELSKQQDKVERQQDQLDQATAALLRTFDALRRSPWALPNIMMAPRKIHGLPLLWDAARRASQGNARRAAALRAAMQEPFAADVLRDPRLMATVLVSESLGAEAMAKALAPLEPNIPWQEYVLVRRAKAYAKTGHPLAAQAEKDLEEFRRYAGFDLAAP